MHKCCRSRVHTFAYHILYETDNPCHYFPPLCKLDCSHRPKNDVMSLKLFWCCHITLFWFAYALLFVSDFFSTTFVIWIFIRVIIWFFQRKVFVDICVVPAFSTFVSEGWCAWKVANREFDRTCNTTVNNHLWLVRLVWDHSVGLVKFWFFEISSPHHMT